MRVLWLPRRKSAVATTDLQRKLLRLYFITDSRDMKMKIRNHLATTILAVAACASAHARSISYDSWAGPIGTGTGKSLSFDAASPLAHSRTGHQLLVGTVFTFQQ
jgi:hypothetical protein